MPYRYINLDEAARHLHLDQTDLERLVKDQEIPFEKRGGRTVFSRSDLDAWASQRILGASASHLTEFHKKTSQDSQDLLASDTLLPELIRPEQIDPAMKAKTKASVLRDIVALAQRSGLVCDPPELIASLEAREELCSTAVPGGVAFLHPRAQQPYRFAASFLVLGRTLQPIHYGAPDRQPTDLFFLLGCQDDRLHLHILARLCLIAVKTDLLASLRAAADASAMHACLIEAEREVVAAKTKA